MDQLAADAAELARMVEIRGRSLADDVANLDRHREALVTQLLGLCQTQRRLLREVTALSGLVRHGNSGGPAVDSAGRVESTIFAARIGARAGYGIPRAPVARALARAKHPVSTGSC